MQKFLIVLVVAQAAVIVLLSFWLSSRSDAGGGAALDPVPRELVDSDGDEELRVRPESSSPKDEPTELRKTETSPSAPESARDAQIGTILFGKITGSDGKLVEGPSVYLKHDDEKRGISAATRTGGYAAPGFRPGTYSITVRANGYKPFAEDVEIKAVAQQRFDVTLRKAREILVTLIDESGAPNKSLRSFSWRGLSVLASETEPPKAYPMTNLRSEAHRMGVGRWRDRAYGGDKNRTLPERCIGLLEVDVEGPVWVAIMMRQQVLAKKIAMPDAKEVQLVVTEKMAAATMATAEVRVVAAESGVPLEGARVSFSDRQSGGGGRPTDANGRVKLEKIVPGILEFEIRMKDREAYHQNLRIAAGKHHDLGTIRVEKMTSIEGKVLGVNGEPAKASLHWIRRERYGNDVPYDRGASASSDAKGKFKLRGCGTGRYFVRASNDDGVGYAVLDSSAGSVTDAVIRLQKAHPVTWVSDVPKDKILLVRILKGGRAVHSFLTRPYGRPLTRKLSLPPDRYEVQILEDSRVLRTIPIDARKPGATFRVP